MNQKFRLLSSFLLIAVFSTSCDRPACDNKNLTFDRFQPASPEYKKELADQIKRIGAENLRYWHNSYIKKGNEEFIIVHVQGKDLCAIAELQVTSWEKIAGLRREPSGYSGAELKGLQIAVSNDAKGTNLVYQNLEKIID